MPAKAKTRAARPARRSLQTELQSALRLLECQGSKKNRDGLARYGIVASKPFGVSMASVQRLAKRIGRDHELAVALWNTGYYEARLLAVFVADPARVTSALMDRWCKDFENWADCDTACFQLFDRTPHAFAKVAQWSRRRPEFERRAAFALLASVALHDKQATSAAFLRCLPLIEAAAGDERNFVKKAVSWALRAIGRRNPELHAAALSLARRLASAAEPSARWIGRAAVKELTSPPVLRGLAGSRPRPAPGARARQARRA